MSSEIEQLGRELQQFGVTLDEFELGKQIGRGGFSEVYLGIHRPTGRLCAIKILNLKNLKGERYTVYDREIRILAESSNRFILGLVGFTSSYPYAIITEYASRGTLYDALHHKIGSPFLSGTQKTILAIGIANGIRRLHKMKVIHRDLKSLNVLLDESLLPKIGDFGLSRFYKRSKVPTEPSAPPMRDFNIRIPEDESTMTQNVGTSAWMAPELFESTTYDNKVDVYAFGMIMWEMLTEEVPFQSMTAIQIAFAVCKNKKRPPFPPMTTPSLAEFITSLWSQNPKDRPTMHQASHLLKHGKVSYPGTDRTQIKKFLHSLKHSSKYRSHSADLRTPPLIAETQQTSDQIMAIISNPSQSDFAANFTSCIRQLSCPNASEFFGYLSKAFCPQTDAASYRLILPAVLKTISGPDDILRGFLENAIHLKLPLANEDLNPICMKILLQVADRAPILINSDLLVTMTPILRFCPQKILRIISASCPIFERREISDFLIQHSESFLAGAGRDYLQILFYLSSKYPGFSLMRAQKLNEILASAFESSDRAVIHAAYGFICSSFESSVKISNEKLIAHLSDLFLMTDAAAYLARQKSVQVSVPLIQALISCAQTERIGAVSLFKVASSSSEACTILLSLQSEWISATIAITDALTLLLIILCRRELRGNVCKAVNVGRFLNVLVASRRGDFARASIEIALTLISEDGFINNLTENGYFRNLLCTTPYLGEADIIHLTILLVDTAARSAMIPDFIGYIPYLSEMLSSQNEYTISALSALTAMSSYKEAVETLRECSVGKIVETLDSNQVYQPYLAILRENLRDNCLK